jgi:hypothetical protein
MRIEILQYHRVFIGNAVLLKPIPDYGESFMVKGKFVGNLDFWSDKHMFASRNNSIVACDEIIYHNSDQDPEALDFALPSHIANDSVEVIEMLERKHGNRKPIPLVRFLNKEE